MRKVISNLGAALCVVLCSIGAVFANNPCMPIAQECMKEGYYKGGEKEGKGLVKDCVMPVLSNQKSFEGVTFTEETRQQCSAMLTEKMANQ